MWKYVCKRCVQSVVALLICSFICFFLIRQLPGSIAYSIYGANAQRLTELELARIERNLLSDQSLIVQYLGWLRNLWQGNWGFSLSQQQEVFTLLQQQSIYTLLILVLAIFFSNGLIIITFILLQRSKFKATRIVIEKSFLLFMIVPSFWFSFLLLWLFSVELSLFPLYGVGDGSFGSLLYHLVLPCLALALPATFYGIKLLENEWATIRQLPFWTQLLRRNISSTRFLKHALPHFCLMLLQLNGYFVIGFLGGTIAIESVFSIPGIGKLTVEATKMHDYPTLLMIILWSLAIVLIVQLLIDLLSCWFDPRVYRSLKE